MQYGSLSAADMACPATGGKVKFENPPDSRRTASGSWGMENTGSFVCMCPHACTPAPLDMSTCTGNVPAGSAHFQSKFNSPTAWVAYNRHTNPDRPDGKEWLQIDAGSAKNIAGVRTQGRNLQSETQCVTEYKVETSLDGVTFTAVDNGAIFIGNVYRSASFVDRRFTTPVLARYENAHACTNCA